MFGILTFLGIGALILLNFCISVLNAWTVGRMWFETQVAGGWPKFMAWMGAIMSACGFTWVYMILLGFLAFEIGQLDEYYLNAMFSLGYLVIILPILGSGMAILVDSWVAVKRRGSMRDLGVAGWNTFAQTYNTYRAMSAIPESLKTVFEAFGDSEGNSGSSKGKVAIFLVIISLLAGVLTTAAIVRITARKQAMSLKEQYSKLGKGE